LQIFKPVASSEVSVEINKNICKPFTIYFIKYRLHTTNTPPDNMFYLKFYKQIKLMKKPIKLLTITISLLFLYSFNMRVEATVFGQFLCTTPGYFCLHVKNGESWKSLWPNYQQRRIVMRVNRMNIPLHPNMVIAVPNNLDKIQLIDLAPFIRQIPAPGEKLFLFDPRVLAWAAYDPNGQLVRWGPAVGGAHWCSDVKHSCQTVAGVYRVYAKGTADCVSHTFPMPNGGAPMPYCMFFDRGQAFHGEPHGLPGYNSSHGCVRLFVRDAQWLNQMFIEHGTKVVINPYFDISEKNVRQAKLTIANQQEHLITKQ
jgi:L,D-transpeptidase ErfK/SrfK